jgi:hypothetical protein
MIDERYWRLFCSDMGAYCTCRSRIFANFFSRVSLAATMVVQVFFHAVCLLDLTIVDERVYQTTDQDQSTARSDDSCK